ncbi:MAG: hypothetical protein ABI577_17275 [bacterium]
MKLRYLFALTAVGALLLGACGGDDDDDTSTTPSGDATQAAPAGSDATKASSEPTKAGTSATKAPDDAASIFDKLTSDTTKKTYQATYDIEITAGGTVQKGTSVIASKPPKLATKITLTGTGFSGGFSVITDGTNTITCTDFGAGGQCTKSAGVDATVSGGGIDLQKTIKEAKANKDVKELDKRTIAGRSSRCFQATDTASGTVSTFCVDEKDSVMTYIEIGGTTKLTATQISTSVDDKLFDPPFPVK